MTSHEINIYIVQISIQLVMLLRFLILEHGYENLVYYETTFSSNVLNFEESLQINAALVCIVMQSRARR